MIKLLTPELLEHYRREVLKSPPRGEYEISIPYGVAREVFDSLSLFLSRQSSSDREYIEKIASITTQRMCTSIRKLLKEMIDDHDSDELKPSKAEMLAIFAFLNPILEGIEEGLEPQRKLCDTE